MFRAVCAAQGRLVCGSDQILSIYKQLQAYHCLAELWDAAVCCIVTKGYKVPIRSYLSVWNLLGNSL